MNKLGFKINEIYLILLKLPLLTFPLLVSIFTVSFLRILAHSLYPLTSSKILLDSS